jgi:hypothetical protein
LGVFPLPHIWVPFEASFGIQLAASISGDSAITPFGPVLPRDVMGNLRLRENLVKGEKAKKWPRNFFKELNIFS